MEIIINTDPQKVFEQESERIKATAKGKALNKSNKAINFIGKSTVINATTTIIEARSKMAGDSRIKARGQVLNKALTFTNELALSPTLALANASVEIATSVLDENFNRSIEEMKLKQARARNGYTDSKSIFISRRHGRSLEDMKKGKY